MVCWAACLPDAFSPKKPAGRLCACVVGLNDFVGTTNIRVYVFQRRPIQSHPPNHRGQSSGEAMRLSPDSPVLWASFDTGPTRNGQLLLTQASMPVCVPNLKSIDRAEVFDAALGFT